MVYLYDACDQITDGQTDRGKTVYLPPPSGSGGINMHNRKKKNSPLNHQSIIEFIVAKQINDSIYLSSEKSGMKNHH